MTTARKNKIITAEKMLNDEKASPVDMLTSDELSYLQQLGMKHNGHMYVINTFVENGDRTQTEKACSILSKLPDDAYLHVIVNVK